MGKTNSKESVVHDWVSELPFMQQALLFTALRGPDGSPKDCPAKDMVKFLRAAVLKPAMMTGGVWTDWKPMPSDSFMFGMYDGKSYMSDGVFDRYRVEFFKDTDSYPMHFLMHLIHAAQVIAYKHPDVSIRTAWLNFYKHACLSLHMDEETEADMDTRMRF